jgi:hypothetical protein
MIIYFDTEFTGLTEHPSLISIGFVSNNEENDSFYAELSDTYKKEDCGEFCLNTVLPLLNPDKIYNKTQEELRISLKSWIEFLQLNDHTTLLVCDSKRDVEQFNKLFPEGLSDDVEIKVLNKFFKIIRKIGLKYFHVYEQLQLRPHHALDDAKANQMVFHVIFPWAERWFGSRYRYKTWKN